MDGLWETRGGLSTFTRVQSHVSGKRSWTDGTSSTQCAKERVRWVAIDKFMSMRVWTADRR